MYFLIQLFVDFFIAAEFKSSTGSGDEFGCNLYIS